MGIQTHGSLFNGIGGFQLAAAWMGWENVMSCEIDPFCNKVTKLHFPDCIQHEDIRTTDFAIYRGRIDILTGGFPCQPFSLAGERKGTEDERHLWPEMLRAIREVSPSWVVGENVGGILSWNEGMVFEQVHLDLEAEGYEVQAFVLPACSVNAPHRRDRVWFIAHAKDKNGRLPCGKDAQDTELGCNERNESFTHSTDTGIESVRQQRKDTVYRFKDAANATGEGWQRDGRHKDPDRQDDNTTERADILCGAERPGGKWPDTDTAGVRVEGCGANRVKKPRPPFEQGLLRRNHAGADWTEWPTQSPICSGNDGVPRTMDGITFPKWRNESIKAYGNAIVPQVAFQIFKAINKL